MQRSCSLSCPYLQFKMCSVLCVVLQFPLEIFAGNFDQTDKKIIRYKPQTDKNSWNFLAAHHPPTLMHPWQLDILVTSLYKGCKQMPIIIIKVCKPEKKKKAECNASINNLII